MVRVLDCDAPKIAWKDLYQFTRRQTVFFLLKISRLLIVKLIIPEKHIATRLQMTTSQPVNLSISRRIPSLIRNTAELERLYAP